MSADGEEGGVIQADRDAAAKLFGKTDWSYSQFVTGKRDKNEKVLAFMRHRLTHATPATDTREVVRLREALEELEARSDAVVAALDKYNAEHGTHIGGAPFFKIGVAIAKARAALAKHPTSPEDAP